MSSDLRIDRLRAAIRANSIIFPSPVPVFARQCRAEVQWRMAALYFVHGWSLRRLGERYKVSSTRVRQALRKWVRRAHTLGYLQEVPAEDLCSSKVTLVLSYRPPPVAEINVPGVV